MHCFPPSASCSRSLPKAFLLPLAVCLGALFYYLQNSAGKILRQWLLSNKDLTVLPQERSKEWPGAKARYRRKEGRRTVRLEQQKYGHRWGQVEGYQCGPLSPTGTAEGNGDQIVSHMHHKNMNYFHSNSHPPCEFFCLNITLSQALSLIYKFSIIILTTIFIYVALS